MTHLHHACALAALSIVTFGPNAAAQDAQKLLVDHGHRGEYERAGPSFTCKVKTKERIPPERLPELLGQSCLHMGALAIGSEVALLERTLGEPNRIVFGEKGAMHHVYFFGDPKENSYLIASAWRERIVVLQLTGPGTNDRFSFNRIALGAGSDVLLKHFGTPTNVRPSSQKDTELWTYGPFSFSFEVKAERVTSIRIADPQFK